MEPYELDEKGRIVGTTLTPEDLASVIEQINEAIDAALSDEGGDDD